MGARITIAPGTRFGQLVTTGAFTITRGSMRYSCVCDCGKKTEPYASRLVGGDTRSCGCSRAIQTERYWTEHRVELLREMAEHSTATEIARKFGIALRSVQSKMCNMGMSYREEPAVRTPLAPVRFPWFENITREEARAIMAGAPKSGAFRVRGVERFSGMGCSAGMCAGWR